MLDCACFCVILYSLAVLIIWSLSLSLLALHHCLHYIIITTTIIIFFIPQVVKIPGVKNKKIKASWNGYVPIPSIIIIIKEGAAFHLNWKVRTLVNCHLSLAVWQFFWACIVTIDISSASVEWPKCDKCTGQLWQDLQTSCTAHKFVDNSTLQSESVAKSATSCM